MRTPSLDGELLFVLTMFDCVSQLLQTSPRRKTSSPLQQKNKATLNQAERNSSFARLKSHSRMQRDDWRTCVRH